MKRTILKKMLLLALLVTLGSCAGAPGAAFRSVSWSELNSFSPPTHGESLKLPAAIQALDGQRVQLCGYVVPLEMEGSRVLTFLLVRDQMLCCFGKMPALNDWVFVECPRDLNMELEVDKPLKVSGRFRAREERENGVVTSLYRMQAERVEVLQNTPRGWKAG